VTKAREAALEDALDAMGARPHAARRLPSPSELWCVEHHDGPLVLRRHDPARGRDIEWVHRFLAHLETSAFPAPRPVPVFAGSSVAVIGDSLWEAVTHVPGTTVKWSRRPTMQQLGTFLATFHDASTGLATPGQRPVSYAIETLVHAAADVVDALEPGDRDAFTDAIADLARGLDAVGHGVRRRSVIHGDFTAHNVLAGGEPLVPVGVIDFANAYVEATIADIGFGLWRSGRPSQRASTFDARRIVSFVSGYRSVRPLEASDAEAIVTYLRARGVQIMVKQSRRGVVDTGPLVKLQWLNQNGDLLQRQIERALP
jgi:Ser/Thr protein kinase RdoA (MazF antagonist)